MTAFRSTRSTRSTGQAHRPAAGACRPSIRAGPGPTGSFHQQPRYSVRGGAGGGGGGRGCSRWSQFALATCAGSSAQHRLRAPAGSFAPTRRSGMMSAPQPTRTHTHPPLPRQHAMVGAHPHHGATDLRLRGQLRQDLRKHAVVLRTCPLLLLPPGPAVVELLKRGQVLGGEEGGGARGKQ